MRIPPGQKLGICIFLSLSIFVIIIACIRIIGFNLFLHVYSWLLFRLHVEGSMAVIMISLAGFRSVFAEDTRERRARPWYSSAKASFEYHKLEDLPSIPSATMSAMRTFIRGSRLDGGPEAYDK